MDWKQDVGSCKIIFGPMFSSKTMTLINELTMCADIGFKVLYVNHSVDERITESGDRMVSSHSSQFHHLSDKIESKKINSLTKLNVSEYDVIGIDEGQFFDDLELAIRKWVLDLNKSVIVASLDGNYLKKSIGQAKELICLCEPGGIIKLAARCMKCLKQTSPIKRINLIPAGFTIKTKSRDKDERNKDERNTDIDVGGKDKYMAVCMKCHQEHIKMETEVHKINLEKNNLNN